MLKHVALMTAASALFVACSDGDGATATSDAKPATKTERAADEAGQQLQEDLAEAADSLKDYGYARRDELAADLREARDEMADRLDALRDDVADATAEGQQALEEQVAELDAELEQLDARLDELASASEDAWSEARDGVVDAFEEFDRALDRASESSES